MPKKTPMLETDIPHTALEEELTLLRQFPYKGLARRSIPTDGALLGVIPRENSRETRFSWATIHGHPYLRIQEFQFDVRFDTWAPVKGRCFTVRVHELAEVKAFIQKAIDLALALDHALAEDTILFDSEDVQAYSSTKKAGIIQ